MNEEHPKGETFTIKSSMPHITQLQLQESLEVAMHCDDLNLCPDVHMQTIVTYILRDMFDKGKTETNDSEVNEIFGLMLTDYTLENLVKKGLVDVSFDENGQALYSKAKST